MNPLTDHLEQNALVSLEKQEKFIRVAAEDIAEMDLDAGVLRFPDFQFPFQVLGTESDNSLSWLWAWADEQTEVPEELLRCSLQMKSWGEKEGIDACVVPSVDLHTADGIVFSLIASAVCEASCYYHDAYQGGGLFLLLFGDIIDRQPGFSVATLSRQFSRPGLDPGFQPQDGFSFLLREEAADLHRT